MRSARTLLYALIFSSALLPGCRRAPEQSVEEKESEEVRSERRLMHQKMQEGARQQQN